jgi:predicted SAM-dependent methyltransferase
VRLAWRAIYPAVAGVPLVSALLRLRNSAIHRSIDPRTVAEYLAASRVSGLHLGCGPHLLPGWLNSDVHALRRDVVAVDATKRFPFANDVFNYVFTEHMIEHLSFDQARNVLAESFRVLKPGGRIRVSTPDLAFLISLTESHLTKEKAAYIEWSCKQYLNSPLVNAAVVINNFVRNWGHQFIFDKETMAWALEEAGFQRVAFFEIHSSETSDLSCLENADRLPNGFVAMESMCAEASKPAIR